LLLLIFFCFLFIFSLTNFSNVFSLTFVRRSLFILTIVGGWICRDIDPAAIPVNS